MKIDEKTGTAEQTQTVESTENKASEYTVPDISEKQKETEESDYTAVTQSETISTSESALETDTAQASAYEVQTVYIYEGSTESPSPDLTRIEGMLLILLLLVGLILGAMYSNIFFNRG